MFQASLCPSSEDRLNKIASGVSLQHRGCQSVSWRWA